MGLFSSIKKAVSKTWSGVKGAVKKVAAGVKKVAKKVAYAIPGGKQLWSIGSKIGKGIMKGIGKVTSKLGPIGTMALSFVLAPVMGPMISSLWSGFGAGAAAMAGSANAFVSALGTAGSSVFAAGNFVGGTLGAMGKAITEGATQILSGNGFSAAANSFATNMSNAFTGKAGMASVNAAAAQASAAAGQTLGTSGASTFDASGQFNPDNFAPSTSFDPNAIGLDAGNLGNGLNSGIAEPFSSQSLTGPTLLEKQASESIFGKQVSQMGLTDMDTFNKFGAEGVKAINTPATSSSMTDKLGQVASNVGQVKSLLGGGSGGETGYQPYVAKAINSANIAKPMNASGQGSAGFSLLGGVQGLEESLRRSQSMMFS